MPFGFFYLLCLFIWIAFACAIWLSSLAMCVLVHSRKYAWPTAFAMAMTFPFVFAYQLLALSPAVLALLCAWFASSFVEAPMQNQLQNPWAISIFLAGVAIAVCIGSVASILGFADGWRFGWLVASGSSLDQANTQTTVLHRLTAVFGNIYRRMLGP